VLLATCVAAADSTLSASSAWIRAIPGSDVAAAYLTLHNGGAAAVTVIGVRCPLAATAMIHETQLHGTQSSMRARETLALAPGATVVFAPGGLHVMLEGLAHALAPGEEVPLVLLFADGRSLTVSARVRALTE